MRRPNVLLLYTDQQRWDALRANGNPDIITPNLDRLANEGVNFDHYFVQNPVCMPSRVSFLSGQYPGVLGITHMGVPVPEDLLVAPHYFGQYGYRTANLGKLHFLPHANRDHRQAHPRYGFDHLEIADEPGEYEDAYRAWVRRQAPEEMDNISPGLAPMSEIWQQTMQVDDGIVHPPERFEFKGARAFRGPEHLTHSAFVADRTIDFLQQQRPEQPFFCIAGFYSPHSPWVAPQRFLDMYDPAALHLPDFPPEVDARRGPDRCSEAELRSARQGYYAMVTEVDDYVGQILDTLEVQGLADNTIVVFTSDHGEWLGEHLRYGKGKPGADVVSRVPLLMRGPANLVAGGRRISDIIEAVDVLPTLLECAGIQVPPEMQGRSFAGQLAGGPYEGRAGALMEQTGWKSIRTDEYRYLIEDNGCERLWHLPGDPGEYHDVATDPAHAAALVEHRHLLLQRLIQRERPLPRIWPY